MPRYANADKLKTDILAKYKKHWEVPCSSEDRLIQSVVTDLRVLIEKNTTADVAPRAEVARGIFEEIEKIRAKEIRKCETLREKESDPSERKYWEGGYNSLRQLSYWIAELKKKYTEGQK